LRRRRKMKMVTPEMAAKIIIDVTMMPASPPDDNVIDFEDFIEELEELPPAAMLVELECELETAIVLLADEVVTGSATALAVHAKAAPASLWSVDGPSVLPSIVSTPATTFAGKEPLMEEIVKRLE